MRIVATAACVGVAGALGRRVRGRPLTAECVTGNRPRDHGCASTGSRALTRRKAAPRPSRLLRRAQRLRPTFGQPRLNCRAHLAPAYQ